MAELPAHGKVSCNSCYSESVISFDRTQRTDGGWRITANPLAWGNARPEVVVLGFSKGPTQVGAVASAKHDDIAYKGHRAKVAKILAHVGLLPAGAGAEEVSSEIANRNSRFHFASLIRCTVEQYSEQKQGWIGTGGDMLGRFVASPFGQEIASNCTKRFLSNLPEETKLVVLFGMGGGGRYIQAAFELLKEARGGDWSWLNDVAYTDGKIVVVHVEHFAAQGALLPQWLGERPGARALLGIQAQQAVEYTFCDKMGGAVRRTAPQPAPTRPATESATTPRAGAAQATQQASASPEMPSLDEVRRSFRAAQFVLTHTTSKLDSFTTPDGHVLYLRKDRGSSNRIHLAVHPELSASHLQSLPGVEEVHTDFLHHSGLRSFPKRMQLGTNSIPYGRQVTLCGLDSLEPFLRKLYS